VNSDRFFLSLVFISSALWFGAAEITGTPTKFISLGLAITSILTAALAVEPFIYSAILVEVAAIIAIPLTMQTGKPVGRGVIRFLIFQSLAMPLVLFGGWLLGGIQASPSDVTRLSQAAIFLGTGFAFWLAVFPFQSWVPLFTQEVNPLIAGFILGLFPIVTLFIMMDFISGLVWLRESQFLAPILRSVGIIMIVTAGVWTAFENDARRIFGYAVLLESGFSFVTISFQTALGVKTLFLSLIPRLVGLSVFGLALALILIYGFKPTFEGMKGLVRKLPFASIAFTLSLLSIIGIPLLAGFPIRLGTLEQLALTNSAGVAWCLIGIAGFF
jgi:NADH-quinone oxidoreductase subunit N